MLRAIPEDEPYDFSKQLFPDLLERGRPLHGWIAEGYWQDVGTLEQYRQANDDALDGKVALDIPGIRLRENVYLGDGVQLPELGQVEGPAYIGNFSRIDAGARIESYSVLGNNVVVKDGATTHRSVIDSGGYIGPRRADRGRRPGQAGGRPRARPDQPRRGRSATSARSVPRRCSSAGCASTRSRPSSPARSSTPT